MTSSVNGWVRRGLLAALLSAGGIAVFASAATSSPSTSFPVARATCAAPGLVCNPCPVTATNPCPDPTGSVAAGVPVNFSGANSTDDRTSPGTPNGTVVKWDWTFGDGTTATGKDVSHAYSTADTYRIVLKVTDDDDLTDTHTLDIVVTGSVAPPPPPAGTPPPPPPAGTPPPPPATTAPTCFGKVATIRPSAGQTQITGTPGADVIIGRDAAESIDGRGGKDLICGGGGGDDIVGGSGNDKLRGGSGDDDLRGGSGDDRMAGDNGADRIDGGAGNDQLDDQALGGGGKDSLFGGSGRDKIRVADATTDKVDCGSGRDSVRLDRRDSQKRCETITRSS